MSDRLTEMINKITYKREARDKRLKKYISIFSDASGWEGTGSFKPEGTTDEFEKFSNNLVNGSLLSGFYDIFGNPYHQNKIEFIFEYLNYNFKIRLNYSLNYVESLRYKHKIKNMILYDYYRRTNNQEYYNAPQNSDSSIR